jgi:hypothetical protein
MSEPQTHIVYRNRVEHDFYESGMMVPLGGGLIVGFLVFLVLAWVAQKLSRDWRGPGNFAIGAAALGILMMIWANNLQTAANMLAKLGELVDTMRDAMDKRYQQKD